MKILKAKTYFILFSCFFGCVLTHNSLTSDLKSYIKTIFSTNICYGKENDIVIIDDDPTLPVYILYDLNPVEGFNLRRDVYIRMAVFVHNLKKKSTTTAKTFKNVKLVLPPFPRLYHWKSSHLDQSNVFWNHFFDMKSLRKFAPVIDFYEFFEEIISISYSVSSEVKIGNVVQLQHFEEMFANGIFVDKFEFVKKQNCSKSNYHHDEFLFGYENVTGCEFSCLKFQGSSALLEKALRVILKKNIASPNSVLFLNTEIVLHDHWGNKQFWQARRSMRFNSNLVSIADTYRKENFNSSNDVDLVQRPDDWKQEKKYRGAKGGNYLCGHLRRADFLYGREKTTPTLKSSANQIRSKLKELNLSKVFISSDCSKFEFQNLKSYLGRAKVYRFYPNSIEQKEEIKDGGQAIIDQIICSHARYFIGTYESTFTYRIYEEREILGFPKETTFNTFCKNEDLSDCERNSVWPIVY